MKRLTLLLALAMVMASGFARKTHEKSSADNLRLLYWNIQNGMWCGQPTNYKEFVDFVKEKNPDVCVWCEASSIYKDGTAKAVPDSLRYLPSHWKELAERYGHKYTYIGGHRDNYPQVITSKYPIENVKRITGEGEGSDTIVAHGAAWARINKNGHPVNIVTLHTWPQKYGFEALHKPDSIRKISAASKNGDKYRYKEVEYICNHTIKSVPDGDKQMWMMMGDFNSMSRLDNRYYHFAPDTTAFITQDYILENTPYIDVISVKHPAEYIPTTGNGKRIDFVYLTRPLYDRVKSAEVIRDSYTAPVRDPQKLSNFWHPSDHLPILIDFDMSK